MSRQIENYVPVVLADGLNTNKAAVLGSTLAVTGATTLSSTLTVSGAVSLTSSFNAKNSVIAGSGATVTLTAAQSGSTVLFDRAAGIVYTLPTASAGLYFDFYVSTTVTSNSATVTTSVGTEFMGGALISIDTDSSNVTVGFTGNGTSHVKVAMNGTTTGGIAGTGFRVSCVSNTLWAVEGIVLGSGTVATPFST